MSTVVSNGPRNLPLVALTFDDGPDINFTPRILDVLEERGAPATFYVVGERVEMLPEMTQRMLRVGGEIGNHAYAETHIDLRQLRPEEMLRSLSRTHEAIIRITGQVPVTFRPPRRSQRSGGWWAGPTPGAAIRGQPLFPRVEAQ